MHKVKFVGVELEGAFHDGNSLDGDFKDDGSVSVTGSSCSEEDCYCYDDCDCDNCQLCSDCDEQFDSCSCDSCLMCDDCNNQYENCDCDREIEHLDECKNKECKDDNVCDDCEEKCNDNFYDNQNLSHNCSEMGNTMINCEHDCYCECNCSDGEDGELVSEPLKPDEVSEWVKNNYPNDMNKTCGIHTHLSFTDELSYMHVIKRDFHDKFIKNLTDFAEKIGIPDETEHEFYRRMNGDEYYCQKVFKPLKQIHHLPTYEGDRYCFINYGYQQSRKTIEIRVLPCFHNSKFAILCIDEIIRFTNDYLSKQKDPEVKEFTFDMNKLILNEVKK